MSYAMLQYFHESGVEAVLSKARKIVGISGIALKMMWSFKLNKSNSTKNLSL